MEVGICITINDRTAETISRTLKVKNYEATLMLNI